MANRRVLKIEGMSKFRFDELRNFCLQYDDFVKEKLNCYSIKGINIDGMPRGNKTSDSTYQAAERALALEAKIKTIEQSAIEADSAIYPYLLEAVTKGLRYEDVNPPCGRRQFYNMRKKFFCLLNFKKGHR